MNAGLAPTVVRAIAPVACWAPGAGPLNYIATSKRGRRREDLWAFALGVALHVAFVAVFFSSVPHSPAAAPAGDDQGIITVALVRGASPASASAAPASTLDSLRQRLVQDLPSPLAAGPVKTPQNLAALLDLIGPPQPAAAPSPHPAVDSARGAAGHQARLVDPGSLASMITPESVDRTELWPQVARCWRPLRSAAAVAMLVRLDERGDIQGQPVVFRRGSGADEGRVAAEQEATRALWDCAPYHLARSRPGAFQLLFQGEAR